MTRPGEDRPIDQAAEDVADSHRRAERELAAARESAKRTLSLARRLRRLREANGFAELMDDAFGGRHG
ncbi:DUF7620 family protein [Nonomuraea rubra]|uniref:DUF7620 family protein n=1 Tax=Nonomuraea rubra TaxID=46180 RepID=UPI003F4D5085